MIFTYLFVLIGAMLVFTALSHILYQKRSPTSMTSWMLAIIFMPYITVPLYFLIGIRKREKKHKKEYVEFHELAQNNPYVLNDTKNGFQNILRKNGIPPASSGNTYELITSDTEAYERMLKEMHNAQESIDICTYVFKADQTTEALLALMTLRAEESIRVRLLMDIVGSFGVYLNQRCFKALKEAGGEIAFFVPILKRPFQNYINLRNHRKIYLFDQTTLLSGGMNLSNEYMGLDDGTERWDDMMYYLRGPAVHSFYSIFHNDWVYATKEEKKNDLKMDEVYHGNAIVQVVPSGPDVERDALYETLINAIYSAKQRIWIVTPYFVPDDNIVQALVIAQHKGVDVKLITPKNSDNFIADMARSSYMRELDAVGVDVVLYKEKMLHAKAILVDKVGGMVGSVNIDNRSLFLNYEVVTFVYSPDFIESIESWMEKLIANSTRGMKKPTKIREASENIMKVFAPLL